MNRRIAIFDDLKLRLHKTDKIHDAPPPLLPIILIILETELIFKIILQLSNRDTNLLHRVAVTHGNCSVIFRLEVDRYTERSTISSCLR